MRRGPLTTEQRFWAKVDKKADTECWLWLGGTTVYGHGLFWNQKLIRAHRFSYELHLGDIPKGLELMHMCDVPGCVNPHHLTPGTHEDNMKDMVIKQRSAFGVRHWKAKLDDDKVRTIKQLRRDGKSQQEVADMFDVARTTIQAIDRRDNWRHIQ
ncbi:MAG: HNH endonuclease [Trueperaceae bacterium]